MTITPMGNSPGSFRDRSMQILVADVSRFLTLGRSILLFAMFGVAAGLTHYLYYSRSFGLFSIFDLGNDFGDLIRSLALDNDYRVCREWPFPGWGYRCFVAHRMPALPLLLAGFGKITDHLLFASITKNAVLFAFSGAALSIACRGYRAVPLFVLLPILIFLTLPYNVFTAASLEFEEGLVFHLLPAAFIPIVRLERASDAAISCVALFLLLLSKSPLFYLCVFLALYGAWRSLTRLQNRTMAIAFLASVLVSSASWAFFTYEKTGRAAWGGHISSWNGWGLYKVNHPKLLEVYPRYSPDYLDGSEDSGAENVPADEWSMSDYYNAQARALMKSDPSRVAKGVLIKTLVALFEVREVGGKYGEPRTINFTALVSRLLFYGLALTVILRLARDREFRAAYGYEFAVLFLVIGLYLGPYFIGFSYFRHLTPIMHLALLWWTHAALAGQQMERSESSQGGRSGSSEPPRSLRHPQIVRS